MHEATLFIFVGVLLATSVLIALAAARMSVPFLVAFLLLGMLLGSDGLSAIQVDDVELVRTAGIVGLAVILFEGGLSTSFRRLRTVMLPAALLSSVGVVITAFVAGLFVRWLFGLAWLESFLLGAVVSSTDAAAVFATLRFTNLKRRLARTLEAESGINDPMAIALTIGLATWAQLPEYDLSNLVGLLIQQLGLGLVCGYVLGRMAVWVFSRLSPSIGAFAPVASLSACALAYGITDVVGGSGFLAVYLVGLAVGGTPSRYRSQLTVFHEGVAFLAQVSLFIILGLFVVPHQLLSTAGASILLALILILLVRPLAVWVSTGLMRFSHRERALLGWAGLRGAVPIVLATIVVSSGLPSGTVVFNIVFFVVLVSALVQGTTLNWLAERLDVVEKHEQAASPVIDTTSARLVFVVATSHAIADVMLKEVGLPPWARIAAVVRDGRRLHIQPSMVLQRGDTLTVVYPPALQPEIEDVMTRWRRRV